MADKMSAEQVEAKIKLSSGRDFKKIILVICLIMVAIMILVGLVAQLNPGTLPLGEYGVQDKLDSEGLVMVDALGDPIREPDYDVTIRPPMLDGVILAALAFLGPYGFYAQAQLSKIGKIEKYLPDFLRDVAEAGRFGMTLANAIVVASSGKYGKLTPEIKKMAAQIQWGVPAAEALRLFSKRVDTSLTNRTVAIITKSSDAGGNVADVLAMVSHAVKEAQLSKAEQKIQMSTYLAVIYIAYMVFLVTILIMSGTFLPAMSEAGASIEQMAAESGSEFSMINVAVVNKLSFIFFCAAIIHGMGDGLVAGILETGKLVSGLRHSFLLLMIGYLMLGVM